MNLGLPEASAVVVANQFNLSIVTQYWLIKHEIISEKDFKENCIFSPGFSDIRTDYLQFILTPQSLTFSPLLDDSEKQAELANNKLGSIIRLLPETPYSALGINFVWHVDPEQISVNEIGRNLFFKEKSPLFKEFDNKDAKFGAYMSKDILGFRLKLDIKPTLITLDGALCSRLRFVFNYHLNLTVEDKIQSISESLSKWKESKDLAIQMLNTVIS